METEIQSEDKIKIFDEKPAEKIPEQPKKKSKWKIILTILGILVIILVGGAFGFFHHWNDKVAYDCDTYLINGTLPSIYERLQGWHIYQPISIMYFTDKTWKVQESQMVKVDLTICKQFKDPNVMMILKPRGNTSN